MFAVGVAVTGLYMATFGSLSYFLTVLLRTVHQFDALHTGLAFLVPSVAIAAGTQLGERLVARIGLRATLLLGFGLGAAGTVVFSFSYAITASFLDAVPGMTILGVGQGIVWTAMWIAAATGVAAREQGIAGGLASTTLNLGNAVGLAVLIAIATTRVHGKNGAPLHAALAHGGHTAVLLTATGMAAGLIIVLALPPADKDLPAPPTHPAQEGDGSPVGVRELSIEPEPTS